MNAHEVNVKGTMKAARRAGAEAVVNLAQTRAWHVTAYEFSALVDLDPVLTEIFFQRYKQVPENLIGTIFGRRDSSKAKETDLRIGSFADPQLWKGQVYYDEPTEDWEITYAHRHLTLGFKVEKTLLEDMQYGGIFDQASRLGISFARRRAKDAASVFNNAFATVTGYDAKTLIATDHPLSKSDSTAVSNSLGTKALTDQNLEDACVQLEGLGDDRGEETGAVATHLIVGRALRQKALQLTGSMQTPEDANNSINTHSNLTPLINPFITGKKWFVADAQMAQMVLKWYDRLGPEPEFGVDDDKSGTLMRSYFGRVRNSFGWSDWRFIVGSNAS